MFSEKQIHVTQTIDEDCQENADDAITSNIASERDTLSYQSVTSSFDSGHPNVIKQKSIIFQEMLDLNSISINKRKDVSYELRIQTGTESHMNYINHTVSLRMIDDQQRQAEISLLYSINNEIPFQKGQLDIFHITPTNLSPTVIE